MLMGRRQSSLEKQKQRRSKFEELVTAVYEYDSWVDARTNTLVYGAPEQSAVSPLAKVEGIAAVYFPSFLPQIDGMKMAANEYHVWAAGAGLKRSQGDIAEVGLAVGEAYKPYLTARAVLLAALIGFARNEFKP